MRSSSILSLLLVASCYLSHGRSADDAPDGGGVTDARMRDAGTGPPGPACRVECSEPEVVLHQDMSELEGLLDVARVDQTLGLLARRYYYDAGNTYPEYALVLVDTAAGTVRLGETADAVRTTSQLVAGGLHVSNALFNATLLRSTAIGSPVPVDALVAGARWDTTGALVWQHGELARMPEALPSCGCAHRGAGFGGTDRSFAAMIAGRSVYSVGLRWGASPSAEAPRLLGTLLEEVPGSAPLDGALLGESTLVLAGGGLARGIEARDAFTLIGNAAGAPVRAMALAGTSFDPPPLIEATADGERFTTFRYVSDTEDLASSWLHAQVHDAAGRRIDELTIRIEGGLVPIAMASFAADAAAGIAWVDREGGVHVLPPSSVDETRSTWRDCGHDVAAPAVATVPAGLYDGRWYGTRPLAALWSPIDDDIFLIVLEPGPVLVVLRLARCAIVML